MYTLVSQVSQEDCAGTLQDIQKLQEDYIKSQENNVELLKELSKVDRKYQQLLRGVLRERRAHVQHLAYVSLLFYSIIVRHYF